MENNPLGIFLEDALVEEPATHRRLDLLAKVSILNDGRSQPKFEFNLGALDELAQAVLNLMPKPSGSGSSSLSGFCQDHNW